MRLVVTAHNDSRCARHWSCDIAQIRFTLHFMTVLMNDRPWVSLPTQVIHLRYD